MAEVHLIFCHGPVVGLAFALLVYVWGVIKKHDLLIRTGLWLFVIAALSVLPVYFSGDGAEEIIEELQPADAVYVSVHETWGGVTTCGILTVGLLSWVNLGLLKRGSRKARKLKIVILGMAIVVQGLISWTAHLGGIINHPEIRPNTQEGQYAPEEYYGFEED